MADATTKTQRRLEGKTALVTGSSRGIGRAIALRLAAEGADVAVHYGHSEAAAREVAAAVEAYGVRTRVLGADLSGPAADTRRLVSEAIIGLGRLDILVNNAGLE